MIFRIGNTVQFIEIPPVVSRKVINLRKWYIIEMWGLSLEYIDLLLRFWSSNKFLITLESQVLSRGIIHLENETNHSVCWSLQLFSFRILSPFCHSFGLKVFHARFIIWACLTKNLQTLCCTKISLSGTLGHIKTWTCYCFLFLLVMLPSIAMSSKLGLLLVLFCSLTFKTSEWRWNSNSRKKKV